MNLADAPLRRISADDMHAMVEAGILNDDDRVELIDGRLIVMEPIGWPHANTVTKLTRLCIHRTPFPISPRNPLRLSAYTEPQPDLVILRPDRDPDGPILGPHALVVVEVADTSIAYDRDVKLERYARAGVPIVWIVDVHERIVDVYSLPERNVYALRETPTDLHLPGGDTLHVSEIFPPSHGS